MYSELTATFCKGVKAALLNCLYKQAGTIDNLLMGTDACNINHRHSQMLAWTGLATALSQARGGQQQAPLQAQGVRGTGGSFVPLPL